MRVRAKIHPGSIYKNPKTEMQKAKYPAIDVHSHDNKTSDFTDKKKITSGATTVRCYH